MKRFAPALALFISTIAPSGAQTNTPPGPARDYFNIGSATFIRENPEAALGVVNEGLSFYPGDEALLRLKKLLEEKQNEQSQQNQDKQDQNDQGQDQKDKQDRPSEEEKQDENKADPEQGDKDAQRKNPGEETRDDREPSPSDMTENEAEMMLDSLRQLEQAQREQIMQEMIRSKIPDLPPVEKDW